MPLVYTFSDFTPGEASAISGVHVETLRTWRKRGALPSHQTVRPSFTAQDVGALMIQRALTRIGMSPVDARGLAEEHAPRVIFVALMENSRLYEICVPPTQSAKTKKKADTHKLLSEAVGLGAPQPEDILLMAEDNEPVALHSLGPNDLVGVASGSFVNFQELGIQFGKRVPRKLLTITWDDKP